MKTYTNKSEYLLASACEIAPLGWWEWDLVNDKVHLSDEVFTLLNRDSQEFNGSIEFIINTVIDSSYRKVLEKNIQIGIETGIVPSYEYLVRKSDNSHAWIRVNGVAIRDHRGQIIQLMGTILDITINKDQEDEINNKNSFYEALMQIIPNPIFYKDIEGRYQYCNQAFSDYIGLPIEKIIGSSVYDLAPKQFADIYHQADLELIQLKGIQNYEAPVKYADGTVRDVLFTKSVRLNQNGEPVGLVGLMYDISERKNNERLIDKQNLIKDVIIDLSQRIGEFANENALYDALIEQLLDVFNEANSGTVLGVTDDEYFIIKASSQYSEDLIHSFKIKMQTSFIWHHANGRIVEPGIVNHIEALTDKFDIPDYIPNNKNDVLRSNLYIPLYYNGKLEKIISLDSDKVSAFKELDLKIAFYIQEQILIIHQLFELSQQTIKLSRYDGLTGFMNRRFFEVIMEDRLETAKRSGVTLTLVVFDLDNLKQVNDVFGHSVGDTYIVEFARLLNEGFRSSDRFARIGGDEFTGTFLNSYMDLLFNKLCKIRDVYGALQFGDETSNFKGRFSFGLANYPEDGVTLDELMYKADTRMYEDKNTYRNKGVVK